MTTRRNQRIPHSPHQPPLSAKKRPPDVPPKSEGCLCFCRQLPLHSPTETETRNRLPLFLRQPLFFIIVLFQQLMHLFPVALAHGLQNLHMLLKKDLHGAEILAGIFRIQQGQQVIILVIASDQIVIPGPVNDAAVKAIGAQGVMIDVVLFHI